MAKRSTDRTKKAMEKRAKRKSNQLAPGFRSKYARKHAYLSKNGLWGFQVPSPKPWGQD